MSTICEFELESADLPLCAVAARLETILTIDQVISGTSGEPTLVFSTTGVDPATLATALRDADQVVEVVAMESAVVESRYRVVLDTKHTELYAELVDRKTYPMGALVTGKGWKISAEFADRADLDAFREACTELGIDFHPLRVFEPETAGEAYGLTAPQQEALLAAHRLGYFEVPRGIDLADLAEELDTTTSALSERLRRAQQALIAHTIASST
jgi:predicted DNA binding protein